MSVLQKLLLGLLVLSGVGIVIYLAARSAMTGVTEMEKNMGGTQQAVEGKPHERQDG